ncbi:DNA primase [Solimonas sp. K1W22B-7]|uniref:DNA primase n=1 Tax=Solimonas sp. K1W22B-7 TaxID=2303331 RepID=UPI000E332345|nr:DNA primase [Solimonas sp. K1W22B-7]AXQ27382.1 DNA primase [Solimonas sp. K1W22B-7]
MSGRIPEAFIHDLLARTDIVEIIGARLDLKRAGKEYKARSPFTNEKSPSFFVSPQKQMFFCFSSGKNGTAISFLMEYDRLSFVEAVEELAQRAGVEVPREGGGHDRVVMDGPLDALAAAQRFFRDQLRSAQGAIDYLKKRGVNGEIAKTFGIGFAPESWDALTSFLKEPKHALEAGLLIQRESGGVYDRFRNRVMFPIRDSRGRVIGFGGRTLANDPAKYLNSPETPLFHKGRNLYGLYEARQSAKSNLPYLLVVEGYMDVVMLAQHGIPEAVATLGTATTREHLGLLFKATSKVVFCFDGDRAGRAAAWRALEQALPEIDGTRECVFMFLPDGHDPDTLVQQIGAEAFRRLVGEAQTLSQFLFGELARQVSLASMDGRAKLAALARPHLEKLRDGPLRSLMLDELARLTRVARADLESMLKPVAAPDEGAQDGGEALSTRHRPSGGANRPVRRAMQLLLEDPRMADRVSHLELLAQADVPGIEVLLEAIDFFHAHPEATAAHLLEFWRDTPKGRGVERLLQRGAEDPIGEGTLEREFQDTLTMMGQKVFRARIQHLLTEGRLRPLTDAESREINALQNRRAIPWTR